MTELSRRAWYRGYKKIQDADRSGEGWVRITPHAQSCLCDQAERAKILAGQRGAGEKLIT